MSFVNECHTIIRRSNKDMFRFRTSNVLTYDYFDSYSNLVKSTHITDKPLDFTKFYFNLDNSDNIYGTYIDDSLKLVDIKNFETTFTNFDVFTYNSNKFTLLFPYIKKLDDEIHILYYVYSNDSGNICALIHHHKLNGVWTENKIDFINNTVLNNFTVIWIQNSPTVFYLNLVNGYEEVFMSKFNLSTSTWSKPSQITNTRKNKIYLSVLKDSLNFCHIVFCENVDNGYAVKYINGYLMDNKLDINISKYITGSSSCMYPSIMKLKSDIYIMWVNYNRLHTSISNDLGKTWSDHKIDEFSLDEDFTRSLFYSNYKYDLDYNTTSVFTTCDDIGILGF